MSVKFEFDFETFEEMRHQLESIDRDLETELNLLLKEEGKKIIEPSITEKLPVSKKKTGAHAKSSKWATQKIGNLEIEIKPNKKFSYLAFPNLGIGKRNPNEQRFMETGRDTSLPQLVDKTNEKLLQIIEEVN